jgi:hypothetical protein
MNDRHQGGETAHTESSDHELDKAWNDLAHGLTAQLPRMRDESDHLIVELPEGDDDGTRPYAQFAGFGPGMVRAELSGNAYLAPAYVLTDEWCESLRTMGWSGNEEDEPNWYVERPVEDARNIAALVVASLRQAFGVAHPQFLTYRAWGRNADGAAELGLSASEDVPVEQPFEPMVLQPEDRDDLLAMIRMTLHAKYDEEPTVDDDGDVVLTHLDQPVWLRARDDMPAVEIFARVVHGVHSRRATAVDIGLLNRDNPLVKWSMRERTVWQHIVIPALPFAPGHLDAMVDVFLATMTATRDDLALRVGGRVA